MAGVVTTAGSLTCAHQGKPALTSAAKLTVARKPVVLYSAVPTFKPWTPCNFQVSGSPKPCTAAAPIAKGSATKLTAGMQPVLLDDLQAGTDNPPPPPAPSVTVVAGQAKLTAS
ncbi:MAG: hypothetical protein ACJ74O_18170 [Frankiaceae bacterium]